MRLSILLFALLGATAFALPTTESTDADPPQRPDPSEFSPQVCGLLYRAQNRQGIYDSAHYFQILKFGGYCVDLRNIYGGYDYEVGTRSLEVFKGHRCTFYTDLDCKGKNITLGSKKKLQYMDTLPADLDRKIMSFTCADL